MTTIADGREPQTHSTMTLAYCDVFPDGHIEQNRSLSTFRIDPSDLLPKLPPDTEHAERGRVSPAPLVLAQTGEPGDSRTESKHVADAPSDARFWVFENIHTSPINTVYQRTSRSMFCFDRKRGVIENVENEVTRRFETRIDQKTIWKRALRAIEEHDHARTNAFAERQIDTSEDGGIYEDFVERASRDAERVDVLLSSAGKTLKELREVSPFRFSTRN